MSPTDLFPLSRFYSLLGVHTSLLVFVAIYLPRTSYISSPIPEQASSRDRPQHPFLRPITADTLLTLLWLCGGVAAVQASWATWLKKETEDARVKERGEDNDEARLKRAARFDRDKLETIKDAVLFSIYSSFVFFVILVLFGAPISSHLGKTFLLGVLLSLLNVYPTVYTLRSPSLKGDANALVHRLLWSRLFVELAPRNSFERMLVYPVIGSIAGAWLGAIPIALDWDRPWQGWPLTPAYGAIFGHIVASWIALLTNTTLFLADAGKQSQESTTGSSNTNSKDSKRKRSKASKTDSQSNRSRTST